MSNREWGEKQVLAMVVAFVVLVSICPYLGLVHQRIQTVALNVPAASVTWFEHVEYVEYRAGTVMSRGFDRLTRTPQSSLATTETRREQRNLFEVVLVVSALAVAMVLALMSGIVALALYALHHIHPALALLVWFGASGWSIRYLLSLLSDSFGEPETVENLGRALWISSVLGLAATLALNLVLEMHLLRALILGALISIPLGLTQAWLTDRANRYAPAKFAVAITSVAVWLLFAALGTIFSAMTGA